MEEEIISRVEMVIDHCIRSLNPDDPKSVSDCEEELSQLERDLKATGTATSLLQRVRAHRISVLCDSGRYHEVIQQTDCFLRDLEHASGPDLSNVVVSRIRALHAIGLHAQEVAETTRFVTTLSIDPGSLLFLLESVIKQHPGSLADEGLVHQRAKRAVESLRDHGYWNLAEPWLEAVEFERWLVETSQRYREINRAKARAVIESYE